MNVDAQFDASPIQVVSFRSSQNSIPINVAKRPEKLTNQYYGWKVLPSKSSRKVESVRAVLRDKFNMDLYLVDFKKFGLQDRMFYWESPQGDHIVVLPLESAEIVANDFDIWTGHLWHEVTHANNGVRRFNKELLGAYRTVVLGAYERNAYHYLSDNIDSQYQTRFRLDEIHARAVGAGVTLYDAFKAVDRNDWQFVRDAIVDSERAIRDAQEMQNSAEVHLGYFVAALKKNFKSLSIEVSDAEKGTYHISLPAKLLVKHNAKQNMVPRNWEVAKVSVKIPFRFKQKDIYSVLAEVLDGAILDARRFDSIFKLQKRKIRILKRRLQQRG